jgi:hypothetical protein
MEMHTITIPVALTQGYTLPKSAPRGTYQIYGYKFRPFLHNNTAGLWCINRTAGKIRPLHSRNGQATL